MNLRTGLGVTVGLLIAAVVIAATQPATTPAAAPPSATEKAIADSCKKWGINPAAPYYWRDIRKGHIDDALASRDSYVRASALGDLMNTRYKREDVVAVLQNYLVHSDPKIRFQAANELFKLGSDAGREVMAALLLAAAKGEPDAQPLADWAAHALHQYRQPINPRVLLAAYERTKSSGLKHIIVLQQLPEAKGIVAAALKAHTLEDQTVSAGILRMDDAATVEELRRRLKAQHPFSRLMAHWALAQCTGSEANLDHVIDLAKQTAGLAPRSPDYDYPTGLDALRLLTITDMPPARKALKEITEHTSKMDYIMADRGSVLFEEAFSALYYVHHDYAYVDQKITELMQAPKSQPDFSVVWQIASERRTPELELLAINRNPTAYEEHFIREQGRPVDSWIYQHLAEVPASLQPKSAP